MTDSKALNVLWVDDDPDMNLKKIFEKNGLRTTIKTNYKEGIKELNLHKNEWDFILLDGRGTDPDKAQNKVSGALAMLKELYALKRIERDIPHCIYTAYIKEDNVQELKDFEPELVILSKGKSRSIKDIPPIVGYIKKQASLIYERQIANLYHDVFEAIQTIGLDGEYKDSMMNFLKALSFEKFRDDCPNGNELRQIIEATCKKLINAGLIPTDCLKRDKNGNTTTEVNIADAIGYLSGNKTSCILGKRTAFGIFDLKGPIICGFMQDPLQKALTFTQKDSHDNTPIDKIEEEQIIDINKHITEYLEAVPSPLFIFSSVLIVCDFLKCISSAIEHNPNFNENKSRAYNLCNDLELNIDKGVEFGIGIVIKKGELFCCGPHIQVLPLKKGPMAPLTDGRRISIRGISLNRNNNEFKFATSDYWILD